MNGHKRHTERKLVLYIAIVEGSLVKIIKLLLIHSLRGEFCHLEAEQKGRGEHVAGYRRLACIYVVRKGDFETLVSETDLWADTEAFQVLGLYFKPPTLKQGRVGPNCGRYASGRAWDLDQVRLGA